MFCIGAQRAGVEEDWAGSGAGQRQASPHRAGRGYPLHRDHALPTQGRRHAHRQPRGRRDTSHPPQRTQVRVKNALSPVVNK